MEPARPAKPAPTMVAIEDPAPAPGPDVLVVVRIRPGEVLEERPVVLGIGVEGQFPELRKGVYGELMLMVGEVLTEWFEREEGPEVIAEEQVLEMGGVQ